VIDATVRDRNALTNGRTTQLFTREECPINRLTLQIQRYTHYLRSSLKNTLFAEQRFST
jgi:hypothetical protein